MNEPLTCLTAVFSRDRSHYLCVYVCVLVSLFVVCVALKFPHLGRTTERQTESALARPPQPTNLGPFFVNGRTFSTPFSKEKTPSSDAEEPKRFHG